MIDHRPTSAMGMIEVKGLSRGLLAANVASNAAAITVDGVGYVHDGVVMVTVRGDVASVRAAVDAAVDALGATGVVQALDVIPRPDADVSQIVADRSLIGTGRRAFGGPGGIGGFRSRGPGFVPAPAVPPRDAPGPARSASPEHTPPKRTPPKKTPAPPKNRSRPKKES